MRHVKLERGIYTYEGDCEISTDDPHALVISNFKVMIGDRPYEFMDQEDEDGCYDFLEWEFWRTQK